MNAKTVFSTALIFTTLGLSTVRGQTPAAMNPQGMGGMPAGNGTVETAPGPQLGQNLQLSSWIRGDKYNCCSEVGGSGPIQTEIFFRSGPSIPFGSGTVADVLQTGLYIGAGGKMLFFDTAVKNAWTVEVGITNIYNHAHSPSYPGIPLTILVPQNPASPVTAPDSSGNLPPQAVTFGKNGVPGVTLRDLNRTFFDMGGGHEWYLWGSAVSGCANLRVGCDGGGRWGSEIADFNEIRHRNDVIGGLWVAAHADYEIPLGCCVFQAGLRFEYGYTWSDILQIQNKSDVQDVNILFNVGVRY